MHIKFYNIIKFMNVILICKFYFFIIIFIFLKIFKLLSKLKVLICTIGKNENKYIKEFVKHYEKLKITKIIIYDNNDINGENFENILKN